MSNEQKLREALLSDMDIAVLRMPVDMAFAGNMARFQYHNRVQALLNRIKALALPPDVPETNFGKMREALQLAKDALSLALSDVDWRKDSLTQPVIHKAYNCAHQALAMPTADHLPDAGEMIETAAPVGEQEAFERTMMDKYGWQRNDFKLDDFGYADGQTDTAWMAWQARAALSAGDAVDAQRYRWLREQHWSNSDICCVDEPKQNVRLGGTCPSGDLLDSAIDAAMRKDTP